MNTELGNNVCSFSLFSAKITTLIYHQNHIICGGNLHTKKSLALNYGRKGPSTSDVIHPQNLLVALVKKTKQNKNT